MLPIMRLFPQELDIPLSEGFSPRLDIFGRKSFGDRLTNIVKAVETPLVTLLDAPWGLGKTTFIKMWIGELNKNRIPAIYFDAFANDYQEDAFIAISSEIISELDRRKAESTSVDKFKRNAVGVAKIIGLSALRIGFKAATAGTIEYADLSKTATEVTQSLSEEAEKGLEEILSKRLESHEEDRLAFSAFKNSLSELASELSKELGQEGISDQIDAIQRPLVFVIDELDRCKPTFALEILEKIKHFFSVPGVSFVLVCSMEQLAAAVRYSYGSIDAHMYLEKFYHIRVLFPSGNLATRDLMTQTYLRHLGCDVDTSDVFINIRCISLSHCGR
jgi:predicted KAP-like P-loop ATPase